MRNNHHELNSVQVEVEIEEGRCLKNTRYKIAICGRDRKRWETRGGERTDDREGEVKWGGTK